MSVPWLVSRHAHLPSSRACPVQRRVETAHPRAFGLQPRHCADSERQKTRGVRLCRFHPRHENGHGTQPRCLAAPAASRKAEAVAGTSAAAATQLRFITVSKKTQ